MKQIHTKKMFRDDLAYARRCIQLIDKATKTGEWTEVQDISNELSAMFSAMRSLATDNAEGIDNFDCKHDFEIQEIRASELAEIEKTRALELARWQKVADKVCAEMWTGAAQ
jgi:hypothetical protein